MLLCFRNLMLTLAALSCWQTCQRLAATSSMFLVVFAAALTDTRAVHVLLGVYALVGVWWLMCAYWGRLEGHLPARSRRSVPVRAVVVTVFLLLLAAAAGMSSLAGGTTTTALAGWIPSSGGTGQHDPFARAGVGDGDMLVRAQEQAESVGAVDSDLFLTSKMPSLYDMLNETFGEADNCKKHHPTEKAIGLSSDEKVLELGHEPTRSEDAGREFTTVRRRTDRRRRNLEHRLSDAVLFVAGRTPLHLRQEVFDHFDGITWSRTPALNNPLPLRMQQVGDQHWVNTLSPPDRPIFHGREVHTIKITSLATNRIPAPAHLTRASIDRVDRLDMYRRAEADIVRLDRTTIPRFTVIHLESHLPDPVRLRDVALRPLVAGPSCSVVNSLGELRSDPQGESPTLEVPSTQAQSRVRQLAESWVADVPPGWTQVEAIVSRLRTEYEFDPDARATGATDDVVGEFLFETRRGPSYLFASAAAVMLRSLGYPTRMVNGFYADPARYNSRARHTPVFADDAHFWPEVHLGRRTWVAVEPTPGYELLAPPRSWSEKMSTVLSALVIWLWAHRLALVLIACNGVAAILTRRLWLGILALGAWRLAMCVRPASALASWTVWLIERRARLAGRARPSGRTLSGWYLASAQSASPEAAQALRQLLQLGQRMFYAPHSGRKQVPESELTIVETCRAVARHWTVRRLRTCLGSA
jgi:transglutaminase-like putative cysteine protease